MPHKDPAARRAYQLAQYHKNKGRAKTTQQRLRARNAPVRDAAKARPCADCGVQYPSVCMDFDHVRGEKRYSVSRMNSMSVENLQAEIAKCDVVCSNCHRLRTEARRAHGTSRHRGAA